MTSQAVDHVALLPLYAAAATAILALLADLFAGRRAVTITATLLGALATGVTALAVGPWDPTFCVPGGCSWVPSWPAAVTAALFAGLTAGVLALSVPALRLGTAPAGEFCFLLACSMTGGVTVAYAGDLLTLIVGLETLTLPLYVLVGLRRFAPGERTTTDAASASVTFFLISVISTAIALLGIALNYAATGAVHLALLGPAPAPFAALAGVGAALLVIGLSFKVAAVPLHAWAPATYDGAPVPIAAYLSTASKLGGVLALAAVAARLDTSVVVAVLAVLTMTVGNLVALRQTRMVRLLAWSSMAQAGYILAALALGAPGVPAALAYAVFLMVLELIAFGVVVALRPAAADGGTLDDFRGAARRHPWLGAALVLALAGLAGLPPGLAGLFAKVSVVEALVAEGWIWLAGVVVVNAVIALAYYVRVGALLYAPGAPVARPVARPVAAALVATTIVAVVLGFAPQLLLGAF
ncbi:NADH-quinone oxidoreductase subunit N [Actinoplanes lobatus]|uniref:NADH-quinone oxidoreductase subunit N n=1 Tax=Actinoplanes lobatus TaxID=113568 RepID=A0A7W7HE01_9ACTN|nr:proton-conducting transporter membrane subunit [Actinoplanes lobatus]MBB4748432.1 NADH-quinone oxidoreductase subunit N [Actinoplanes lobatus]GGN57138.1 NADH-quinone oxidoreductase subunit N [Actinoplanes lobatus]GIE37666.1 NADH-quinone oxidoreductase subunit N [Actinoplanes lobatus]